MTIESTLDTIQNFRSLIDQWGVTAETLVAVAFLAGVMFVLSLREVLTWFLRVHTVRDELKSLRGELAELKAMLLARPNAGFDSAAPIEDEPEEPVKKKVDEKPSKSFRLDH